MQPQLAPPDATAGPPPATSPGLSLEQIYDHHAATVWRTLRALGVDAGRLDDAMQDVFLVVHRRLAEFEQRSSITTWLYGIARRVAADHRRRRTAERRLAGDAPLDREISPGESPLDAAQRREAAALLLELLDELDDDKREVFALMEIEQLAAPVVAELLGIPLNTVYSRLRLARQRFEAAVARRRHAEEIP
ncbi:MAG: sigma-70 family RNA polymerase sigma factor [Kofleriaceae bacterium]|nr:sigma-70 family RNA polymerase sigma factor [Myxococcales bacterium]MCB9562565.1 sigma-70 family RNA polymerase sigma factor [Kofleriaceae bacterium]